MIRPETARKPRPAATTTIPKKPRARWVNNIAVEWAHKQELSHSTSYLLVTIAEHADLNGECYPGQDRLALLVHMKARTVRAKLRELVEEDLIEMEFRYDDRGYRVSSLIRLKMPVETVEKADVPPEQTATPTGKNDAAYRHTAAGTSEHLEDERKSSASGSSDEARPEPSFPSQSQPIDRQAGRVEIVDRPCHKPTPPPPRGMIDAKAVEFIDRAYPWHHAFTDRDRAEGASAFLQAVMRGNDPDLIIWAAFYYRAKMQREQGRRPELPLWWIRKQRWTDQPGGDYFMASASDPKERRRLMACAEGASWMR